MTQEINLNEALNTGSENVASNEGSLNTVVQNEEFTSVYDYIRKHKELIQGSSVFSLDKITDIPAGKYLLFKTISENDADLVLIEQPNHLWVKDQVPTNITVKNSGIIIKTENKRSYISKNNVTEVLLADGKIQKISTHSKSKTKDNVKTKDETVEKVDFTVDNVKLYIKKISPRLNAKVKDLTSESDITTAIMTYMNTIQDINHLIKIEVELLFTCGM